MSERQTFWLVNDKVRGNALAAVRAADADSVVTVAPKKRSSDQNAKFHGMCSDLAHSPLKWAGKRRTPTEWKILLISAHAVATDQPGEVIPGLESEFVAIRESSARMTVQRMASLIEYTLAYCATNGVVLRETVAGGFVGEDA